MCGYDNRPPSREVVCVLCLRVFGENVQNAFAFPPKCLTNHMILAFVLVQNIEITWPDDTDMLRSAAYLCYVFHSNSLSLVIM